MHDFFKNSPIDLKQARQSAHVSHVTHKRLGSWVAKGGVGQAKQFNVTGSREAIRLPTTREAIKELLSIL